MDTFIEQIVTKKPDARDIVAKIGLIIVAASMCTFCVMVILLTGAVPILIIIPGILWVANFLIKSIHTEYEYILTNQELDIDKITGKSKRKRLITLNLRNAKAFGAFTDTTSTKADTTVSAHNGTLCGLWYVTVEHDSHGTVLLLFNPDERFAEKMNGVLPPKVRVKPDATAQSA